MHCAALNRSWSLHKGSFHFRRNRRLRCGHERYALTRLTMRWHRYRVILEEKHRQYFLKIKGSDSLMHDVSGSSVGLSAMKPNAPTQYHRATIRTAVGLHKMRSAPTCRVVPHNRGFRLRRNRRSRDRHDRYELSRLTMRQHRYRVILEE